MPLPPGPSDCPPPAPVLAPDGDETCCDMMIGGAPVGPANKVPVDATLVVGDIEIGAVEIKNHNTDDRVQVNVGHEMSVTDATTHTTLTSIDAGIPVGLGAALTAASMPVTIASDQVVAVKDSTVGVATVTADAAIAAADVVVLAANANRKGAIIQNTGGGTIRVNIGAVAAAATGIQLTSGSILRLSEPWVPQTAVHAIREGATSSTCSVMEIV